MRTKARKGWRENSPTCRGFGEKRGTCRNPPGKRKVGEDTVPSLCSSCEAAFIENNRSLAGGVALVDRARQGGRR